MLIPKPRLHPLAKNAIDELAREGITCTPDEIFWLQELAGEIQEGASKDLNRFAGFPTPCGNVRLWPLSIGARRWFRSVSTWFDFDDQIFILALGFTMAHGREPDFLLSITNRAAAIWKILAWSRRLTCSLAELSRAIDATSEQDEHVDILNPREENEKETGIARHTTARPDWGAALARLSHYYPGHTLGYWLWELPDETVAILLNRTYDFIPVEERESREDKNFQKLARLRLVVKHIRESRQSITEN